MKKTSDPKNNKQGSSGQRLPPVLNKKTPSEAPSPEQIKDGSPGQMAAAVKEQSTPDRKEAPGAPQSAAVIESETESMMKPASKKINALEQKVVAARKEQIDLDKEQTTATGQQSAAPQQSAEPQQSVELKQAVAAKPKPSITGITAMILVLGLAGAGYYFYLQLNTKLNTSADRVAELTRQQLTEYDQTRQKMTRQLAAAQQQIQDLSSQVTISADTLSLLQDKLLELSGRRPSDWLLAEANYLVKLAGRKLWQEKDQQTASSLLATADLRIAEMNEPSLISLRKALAKDIAAIQSLPADQTASIALRIDGLISQVDNLKLNMVKLPEPSEAAASDELSASASDWQDNLSKTWHSFTEGFITIRRRNGSVEPLMSPKQQWYLEENLKSKLIQSQLALYRHQQDAFEHAIELSTRWVMQFYDRKDSTTEFMLKEFSQLQQLDIASEYPALFYSSDLLYAELTRRNITASNGQGR